MKTLAQKIASEWLSKQARLASMGKPIGSNWATKALEKIINQEWLAKREQKPFDTARPFAVIANKIQKLLASWDIKAVVKVQKEIPKRRWGDVNYVLNVQATPPVDMDPSEFLGVMDSILDPSHPFTLRQLQRSGTRWTFRVVLAAVDPTDWDY